ncbi:MAG: cystathionine gamma-synthase family protein [Terriglobales bacterium]
MQVPSHSPPPPSGGLPEPGPGTSAVWAGENGVHWQGATQVPICQTAAFAYPDLETWLAVAQGRAPGHIYSRNTNPTVAAFEAKIRALEHAPAATSFASGMAAISAVLFTLLSPGDRVVSIQDTYGGTHKLFLEFLPRFQIAVTLCPTADTAAIEAALPGARLLYLESPTNPTLKVVDLAQLAAAARRHGVLLAVDNTFATPLNQQPLALGADLVIHSATKFLGGHGDALGGAVCGGEDLLGRIFHFREITGACLDPLAAYLLLRGMKTLALRVERQNRSAQAIAEFLAAHPRVTRVFYPGLPDHPGHDVARRQMRGFGGVLSFVLAGGWGAVGGFLPRLRYAHRAANLGAVETTAGPPATTSHVEASAAERTAAGIPEALVRYSVGIEDPADLIADLGQALAGL